MKKILLPCVLLILMLCSCESRTAKITDAVIIGRVDIIDNKDYKYQVSFKTAGAVDVLYYTNYRYQVGDTMNVVSEMYCEKDRQIANLNRKLDSVNRVNAENKMILELLKERLIIDSTKKR